jgi:hypothetical protein
LIGCLVLFFIIIVSLGFLGHLGFADFLGQLKESRVNHSLRGRHVSSMALLLVLRGRLVISRGSLVLRLFFISWGFVLRGRRVISKVLRG